MFIFANTVKVQIMIIKILLDLCSGKGGNT